MGKLTLVGHPPWVRLQGFRVSLLPLPPGPETTRTETWSLSTPWPWGSLLGGHSHSARMSLGSQEVAESPERPEKLHPPIYHKRSIFYSLQIVNAKAHRALSPSFLNYSSSPWGSLREMFQVFPAK